MRCLLLSCLIITGAVAADTSLLDRIVAAQQGIEHLTATLRYTVIKVTDQEGPSNNQRLKVALKHPSKYRIMVIPLRNGVEEERREWWLSDGKQIWHAEREFADEEAEVDAPKPVGKDGDDLGEFIRLFRMDRNEVDKRFAMTATDQLGEKFHDEALYQVDLLPKEGRLAKNVKGIALQLGEDLKTRAVVLDDMKDNRTIIRIEQSDYETEPADDVFVWKD